MGTEAEASMAPSDRERGQRVSPQHRERVSASLRETHRDSDQTNETTRHEVRAQQIRRVLPQQVHLVTQLRNQLQKEEEMLVLLMAQLEERKRLDQEEELKKSSNQGGKNISNLLKQELQEDA